MEKGEKSNKLSLNFNKAWNFRPNPESNSNWVKKVDENESMKRLTYVIKLCSKKV